MTNKDKDFKATEVDLFGEVDLELKESIISTNKLKKTELRKSKNIFTQLQNAEANDRAALIEKEAIRIKKRHINKELASLAKVKIESLQSNELKELKKLDVEVTPKDLIQIMTFLALSSSPYGELAKQDIIKFFDDQCNFLHEAEFLYQDGPNAPMKWVDDKTSKMIPYDPCSCLYQWFYRVDDESIGGTDYKNKKLDIFQIYTLQVEMFIKMFDVYYHTERNEGLSLPSQRPTIKKLLDIGLILYPHEFKKILNAGTQYLDDRGAYPPNIVANDQNGVLQFKLLHRPMVFLNIFNYYNREEVICDYIVGGLILEAFGVFNAKTPKYLHGLFDSSFSVNTSQRISREKRLEEDIFETYDEYAKRYRALAYAWNDGLFGPFEYLITEEFVSFKWKYPKFFQLDSIADIEADHSDLFGFVILDHEGGTKDYPIAYGAEYRGGKI
jgi:hypothetical protein